MSDPPRVSVILPSYDRLAHLRTAVASVLAQTWSDLELLIADDGSGEITRGWLARLDDPRVRWQTLPHSGSPSITRNAAIRAARGRYLAFIDSDDTWLPTKLERQLDYMARHPQFGWSYHACGRIDAHGRDAPSEGVRPFVARAGDIVDGLLELDVLVATPTVMAERALVERIGAFDETQRFGEDYDLWIRLTLESGAGAFDEPLAQVRVHDDNLSRDRRGAHRDWVRLYGKMTSRVPTRALRALCRRRRAQSRLALAAATWSAGERGRALGTFAHALAGGWRSGTWWRDFARYARATRA